MKPRLDHDTKMKVAQTMRHWGGSFVIALAECLILSDSTNQAKIEIAWWNYIEKYAAIAGVELFPDKEHNDL